MAPDIYPVKDHVAQRAYINSMEEYQRLYRLSLDNPDWFWGEQAKALTWYPCEQRPPSLIPDPAHCDSCVGRWPATAC